MQTLQENSYYDIVCIHLMSTPVANPTRKFIPGVDVAPGQGNDEEYVMLKDATTILEDIRKSILLVKGRSFPDC